MPYHCFNCGKELIWSCDYMASEIMGEELVDEEDNVVGIYTCPNCKLTHEFYFPSNNDLRDTEDYKGKVKLYYDKEE